MKPFILLLSIALLFLAVSCQHALKMQKKCTFMFYNVENLFDTIDDPHKTDNEFMPVEPKNWNTERYRKKISDLARVISLVDTVKLPAVIGLAEVENDIVLTDLINEPVLKDAKYCIAWEGGPDIRGIDCALLYQPDKFRIDTVVYLKITIDTIPRFKTRDILYASGWLDNDYMHLFVNHWPSRRGGEEESEVKRERAAEVLRAKVDQIFENDSDANILIMGDMNDEPADSSLLHVLKALPNSEMPKSQQLVNLMWDEFSNGEGSYSYRNDWSMLDNIVVSSNLLVKRRGYNTSLDNGFIFHLPFMEFVNNRGEMSPNRTYGRSYYGGISDHFPVYVTFD